MSLKCEHLWNEDAEPDNFKVCNARAVVIVAVGDDEVSVCSYHWHGTYAENTVLARRRSHFSKEDDFSYDPRTWPLC